MSDSDDDLHRRLLELFAGELAEHLATLNAGLLDLERGAGSSGLDHDRLLRDVFRAAHSVKGAAHAVTLPRFVAAADALETLLAQLRDGSRALDVDTLARLFRMVDELTDLSRTELVAPPDGGAASPVGPESRGEEPSAAESPAAATVRVAASKLDVLMAQTGQLTTLANRVEHLDDVVSSVRAADATTPAHDDPDAPTALGEALRDAKVAAAELRRDVRRLAGDMTAAAQALRLQRFAGVLDGFDRAVRDLARTSGTEVDLVVIGGELELDRDVATNLRDPLLHLVRNAVAHGAEPPDERRRAGKAPRTTVEVSAHSFGDRIEVTVRDDGRGLDVAALESAAERAGVAGSAELGAEVAFVAGVTTAPDVSATSGRGVGLDAVRSVVERWGGSVRIESGPDAGTSVVLELPISRTLAHLLMVVVGDDLVAVPFNHVRRILTVDVDELVLVDRQPVLVDEGQSVPVTSLASALGHAARPEAADGGPLRVVVAGFGAHRVAFTVDGLRDGVDGVVEALPNRLGGLAQFIGTTTLRDGRMALVVNVPACIRRTTALADPTMATAADRAAADVGRAATVLLVEDTLTTRALERSILETAGYEVLVAADGVEALTMLSGHSVDIVVSDVDMPRMDGVELCRAIRSSAALRDLPIILVTSLSGQADRDRGMSAGASAYLAKSAFDRQLLLETVEQFL